MTTGPVPLAVDTVASLAFPPGAYTKLILSLNHVKTGTAGPSVWGVKPGYENSGSCITAALTADYTSGVTNNVVPFATMGTVIDCYAFKAAGGDLPTVEAVD